MRRCFQLACLGAGSVSPNPLVGSVLVYENKIIAEGYHKQFGGPHAEVEVLQQVSDTAILKHSMLYVNLEPCSHTGKTPPCTDLIISRKVGHVVISIRDPFAAVNGKGVKALRDAGIEVTENILSVEGSWLNRRFITHQKSSRPYVVLKWAESADGFIAPFTIANDPAITWISNAASRILVHFQRNREQAILVGHKTVSTDNPRLNVRGISGKDPVRIVIDPHLKLDNRFHVFDQQIKTFVVNISRSGMEGNLSYLKINRLDNLVGELLDHLCREQIQSVLVEGGTFTIGKFIDSGLWDEALVFRSNKMLNEGITAPATGTPVITKYRIGSDNLSVYLNNRVA